MLWIAPSEKAERSEVPRGSRSGNAETPTATLETTDETGRLWFLPKNKRADAKRGIRDRRKQNLFIDVRRLGTLRDTLLPKLLSGEVTTNIPKPTQFV